METDRIQSIIESIIFVSGEPLEKAYIAKIADATMEEVELALEKIQERYQAPSSGLSLVRKDGVVQLVSNPQNSSFVEGLVKSELSENISPTAMEVLAIIAYRGPISKSELESLRGVNCAYILRSLLLRRLIEKGDTPRDSRGYTYSITVDFLKKLGIDSVERLPSYAILSAGKHLDVARHEE